MKNSLSSMLVFPRGGADGELGDSARITLPRIDLVADGERGVAARITSPGPGLGAEGYQLLPLKRNRKMCDSILYAPMD
ncbi:hypothetical protein MMK59_006763, partial [Pseudomonas aeruginosa]